MNTILKTASQDLDALKAYLETIVDDVEGFFHHAVTEGKKLIDNGGQASNAALSENDKAVAAAAEKVPAKS